MSVYSEMQQELTSRKTNHSLPRLLYTDENFFQLDLEGIFYREWLFVGHGCEVPGCGDYLTYDIGSHSVIVIRGKDNQVRALHNTCRHRGSRVCENAAGSSKRLVCPYHQWMYDLDGKLLVARDMNGIELESHGLKPVHCRMVDDYVFINLADTASNFDEFSSGMELYLKPNFLKRAKIAYQTRIVEPGNWKLVWENFRECYHCDSGHPELSKTFPVQPFSSGQIDLTDEPLYQELWKRCERANVPCQSTISGNDQYRVIRGALHASSMTLSGEPAVSKLMGELTEPSLGSGMLLHHPSFWGHVMADHTLTFRVTPLQHNRTELVTKWLVHEDAVEGEDYDLPTLTEVWTATNNQDSRFVGLAQKGIQSPAYIPGPYSASREIGTRGFVDWYCASMGEWVGTKCSEQGIVL